MSYHSRLSVELLEAKRLQANVMATTICYGLAIANKGNAYWTKRDAMQSLAMMHRNNRSA